MRVAHWVYDLIRGGTEGQCARTAVGLSERGGAHRVLAFHRRGWFLERVEGVCGPVEEVRVRKAVSWNTWRELRRVARWLKREKIDILHTWDADAAVFGQWAAEWAGVKLVTSRRDLGSIYPAWKRAMLRRADARAARVVVNAEAVWKHFAGAGVPAEKLALIPNILDVAERDRLAGGEPERALPPDRGRPGHRMVVVNRLDPEKNTGLLIRALAKVREQVPDASLWVVGEGVERRGLETLAEACGVADAVDFLLERHDVPVLLGRCAAGALVPKANEGLSNTVLEYMAAGLPSLVTDCGGNAELVADGERGRVVRAGASPEEVAEAWAGMLLESSRSREWGATARRWVAARHVPERVLPLFESLYREVAGK
ncbi:MAG: glycosyltransferase [Kiritimatiellae bacterium]|nr:glycosyltransferase [Kiritimatiellia bacterium]